MTINFILNGEDVTVQTDANTRLLELLRTNFKLLGAKTGCLTGKCGVCSIMLNGKVVPSCLIPAFRIRGTEIITLEGFSQTDEYGDVLRGFEEAGVENCGYCDSAKILTAGALLDRRPRPTREEILEAFSGIRCRCTDGERLVDGVITTADIRQRRLYGRVG